MKYVYFTEILEFIDNVIIIAYKTISSTTCYVEPSKAINYE